MIASKTFSDIQWVSRLEIKLFCFILDYSEDSFSVKVKMDKMVEDLKDEIIRKAKADQPDLA